MNAVPSGGPNTVHHGSADVTGAAGRITISAQAAARLVEVLQLCETFLTTPGVRAELADFCLPRPGVSSGWLIDMLGWHALHLRARIGGAGEEQR